jgi:hypothetical protein
VLLILQSAILQTIATGYKPDPTHRYEHKQDIEKLLHPNQEIHTVQYQQDQAKRRQESLSSSARGDVNNPFLSTSASAILSGDEEEEDPNLFYNYQPSRNKALNIGFKNRCVQQGSRADMPLMHSSMVTNILDVSAAVERESVFTWKNGDDVAVKNRNE